MKKFIPIKIKQWIITTLKKEEVYLPKGKRVFIFLSADYGNIGDLAISAAQRNFIAQFAEGYEIVTIPISKTIFWINSIKKKIRTDDIITIIGGGNMGSLYPDIEGLRQLIIQQFCKNRIICFPQTLDWDESKNSSQALNKIVRVYSSHPDIHIFARESITYKKLKKIFNNKTNVKIGFVPDIVMSASAIKLGVKGSSEPRGILTCLRNDKECFLNTEHYTILDKAISDTGITSVKTDTHAGGSSLDEEECTKLLLDKIQQFAQAQLVITDRLHGMILCILSGTPCLVLPNSNHKISQTYLDWLEDSPRVIFMEVANFNQILDYINYLLLQPRGNLNEIPVDLIKYNALIETFKNE